MVCRKLIKDWGEHEGQIYLYGDASGGASGSAKVAGSDWDIIRQIINNHFGSERTHYRIPTHNPSERERINAVNSRCKSMDGIVRLLIDPSKAPMTLKDFEGVQYVIGGAGEIDKKRNLKLTHLTDAIGYYIAMEFPVSGARGKVVALKGI